MTKRRDFIRQSVPGTAGIAIGGIGLFPSALPHLGNISCRLGRELRFMGDYEKFANDPEADTMLSRNYRKPFVVPVNV